MTTTYCYSDKTANAMLTAIATSDANDTLYRNIKDYLYYTGKQWWENLSTEAKEAIRLLDFDSAVVSTMMFFSKKGDYFDDYLVIREAISDLVNTIADEVMPTLSHGYVKMPTDASNRVRYNFEMKEAVLATCLARKTERDLSDDLDRVFNLYDVQPHDRKFAKAVIITDSGVVKNHYKNRNEAIKTIRKECLSELMDYLRGLSKGE